MKCTLFLKSLRLLSGLLIALPAAAQSPVPLSSEFQVNSFTTNYQLNSSISTDGNGRFVVVWQGFSQDGDGSGIFSQRYDSNGNPLGAESLVNTYTAADQGRPAIAADGNGDLVIVWESWGNQDGSAMGVFGQRFSSDGGLMGSEFQVNTYTLSFQNNPAVAWRTGGDFMVVWESLDQAGSDLDIFSQLYASDGVPVANELQVNTYTISSQSRPAVTTAANGDFVVVWQSQGQDGSGLGVFAQRYASSGGPVGSEFQVNTFTVANERNPTVAAGRLGGFNVAWHGTLQDGDLSGVFAQQFAGDGIPIGSELQINTFTAASQENPAIASDGNEGFVVAWQSYNQDGSHLGVFGQHIASNGIPKGTEFQINTFTDSGQFTPAISSGTDGNFVVAWDSVNQDGQGYGVFAQRFSTGSIFADGFESQGTGEWSSAVRSGG